MPQIRGIMFFMLPIPSSNKQQCAQSGKSFVMFRLINGTPEEINLGTGKPSSNYTTFTASWMLRDNVLPLSHPCKLG